MDVKPGIKTTEFWLTLTAQLIPLLVIFGVLNSDEASDLSEAVAQLITAIGAVVASAAPIVAYIQSRTRVKSGQESGAGGHLRVSERALSPSMSMGWLESDEDDPEGHR